MHRFDSSLHPPRVDAEERPRLSRIDSPDPLFDAFEFEPPHRPGAPLSSRRASAKRSAGLKTRAAETTRAASTTQTRRFTHATILAASLGATALFASACDDHDNAQVATDAILVQLRDSTSLPAWTRADDRESAPMLLPLASIDGDEAADESDFAAAGAPLLRVPISAGEDPRALAAALARDPAVAFAEPIAVVHAFASSRTPDDPRFRDLWGLAEINAPAAWAKTVGDRSVVVSVIDNGVALTHPDLQANLWNNAAEIAGNGLDDDQDGIVDDVHGASFIGGVASGDPAPVEANSASAATSSSISPWHGTHVAGIIGAVGDNRVGVVGVNWRVSLMAVRALGDSGGRSDDLVRAIDYASSHGARVINASWGSVSASQAVEQAIARAGIRGALFVAAAGNESAASPAFPANIGADNLISVGALDANSGLAAFSNRGAMVAAPGVGILSTTSPGSYEREDGTSTAAPHVTGLAALLFAASPRSTAAEVRAAILSSSIASEYTSSGRIDAAAAIDALEGLNSNDPDALILSRESLSFSSSSSEAPRAQTISVRARSGGPVAFSAASSAAWASLVHREFTTPARATIRVDPSGLAAGDYSGAIVFTASDGATRALELWLQVGIKPAITTLGDGCSIEPDGILHVSRGALCTLVAPGFREDASAPDVSWNIPGAPAQRGARLNAIFPRRASFRISVSTGGDPISIAIQVD